MYAEEKSKVWTSGRILFGIVVSLAFCFLVACIATYSPLDPPGESYAALQRPVHNLCGAPGAYCANLLYRFCGYGVWFLLIPVFLRLVSFWRLSRLRCSILKTVGTFMMLAAVSGALSAFLPGRLPNAPVSSDAASSDTASFSQRLAAKQTELGPGGELGVVTRFVLDKKLHIAPVGIGIFLVFLFAAGLILASDSPLLRFLLNAVGLRSAAEILAKPPREETIPSETDLSAPAARPERPAPRRETENDAEPDRDSSGEEEPDDEEEEKPAPYLLPPIEILPYADPIDRSGFERRIEKEIGRLQKAFDDYNCDVRVVGYQSGPVVTLYELELSKGQKLAQINSLSNELAIAMKVPSVRIVFPIPGKSSVGVEVPNKVRQFVRLRNVMEESAEIAADMQIPLFIGKDVAGDPIVADLAKLPHLLIGGRTGTGKSVCLNSIILSILMTKTPAQVRLVMIDPKMVELSPYKQIPHLMYPVLTDMKQATAVLNWLCEKMDERYNLLSRVAVRQLKEYNRLTPKKLYQRFRPQSEEEWERLPKQLPAIVVIADEIADMMAIAGKDVSDYIARLAAKSRAVGIHLILATQKPTVDVVTGLIKSNLPARIAFGVATQSDSRVILDVNGAEKLLGNGDLLFHDSVTNDTIRGQGTFVDDDEVFAVKSEISVAKPEFETIRTDDGIETVTVRRRSDDPLYDRAVELILTERRASTSFLQRRFSIGYGRAAKIIDSMEDEGLIGPKTENDSKPRKILKSIDEWRAERQEDEEPQTPTRRASLPPSEPLEQKTVFFEDDGEDDQTPAYVRRTYSRPESPAPSDEEEWDEDRSSEDEEYGWEEDDSETAEDEEWESSEDADEEYDEDDEYAEDDYDGEGRDDGEFAGEGDEYDDEEYEEDDGEYTEDDDEGYGDDGYDGESDVTGDGEYDDDGDGESDGSDDGEHADDDFEPDDPVDEEPTPPPAKSHKTPPPNLRDLARRRRLRKKNRRDRREDV